MTDLYTIPQYTYSKFTPMIYIYELARPLHFLKPLAVSFIAVTLVPTASVFAQAPPTPTASPTPTARPAVATAETERVVVTAEKREQNPQEVPSSISVINDVELDNLHATSLRSEERRVGKEGRSRMLTVCQQHR